MLLIENRDIYFMRLDAILLKNDFIKEDFGQNVWYRKNNNSIMVCFTWFNNNIDCCTDIIIGGKYTKFYTNTSCLNDKYLAKYIRKSKIDYFINK
jgi:hypothetical protein